MLEVASPSSVDTGSAFRDGARRGARQRRVHTLPAGGLSLAGSSLPTPRASS